jgi:hypothetical protein
VKSSSIYCHSLQWLPQVPRHSILRFTQPNDLILSNFLGQGTDAIECFLLERRLVGLDINPSSVILSRRNTYFSLPANGHSITPAHRPRLIVGDARSLSHPSLGDGIFDHVLCHPPYKNAVKYTDNIEGDLSLIGDYEGFSKQLLPVAQQAHRVLKMGKRATLCMGDNRSRKVYQPLAFDLVRSFVDAGFEVEELIVKRQRYMEYSPLGKILASTFNFQYFNHELVAIVRKAPDPPQFKLPSEDSRNVKSLLRCQTTVRRLPFLLLDRKAGAKGTLWVMSQIAGTSFAELSLSKVMERFGHNNELCEFHDLSDIRQRLTSLSYKDSRVCAFPPSVAALDEQESLPADPMTVQTDKLSAYEEARNGRVNLLKMKMKDFGLVPTPDPEPGSHFDLWKRARPIGVGETSQVDMIVIPPLEFDPESILTDGDWVDAYRRLVLDVARNSVRRLKDGGTLIVGARDVRVDRCRRLDLAVTSADAKPLAASEMDHVPNTRLVPLSMLLLDDCRRGATLAVSSARLKLRELTVVVPENHHKRKTNDIEGLAQIQAERERIWAEETSMEDGKDDGTAYRTMLPIVHFFFYIFELSKADDDSDEEMLDEESECT